MADSVDQTPGTASELAKSDASRPSVLLLVAGTVALLVSAWALIGPVSWLGQGAVSLGPIVVIAAIVAGAALVFSPRRPRK